MKKLLAILLSILLVLSLAACGGNTNMENQGNGGNLIIGPGGSDEGNEGGDTVSGGDVVAPPSGEKPSDEVLEAIEQYRKIILILQKYEPGGEIEPFVFEDFGFLPAEPIEGSKAILHYYSVLQGLEIIDPWMGTEYANTPNMLWDRQAALENVLWTYWNYIDLHNINGIPDASDIRITTRGGFKRAGTVQGDKDTICLNDYLIVDEIIDEYEDNRELQIRLDFDAMVADYQHRLADTIPDVEIINKYKDPLTAAKNLMKWMTPVQIVATSHEYTTERRMIDVRGVFSNATVVPFSWEEIGSELATYRQLLDVDFVYEDFTYTCGGMIPLMVYDLEQMVEEEWIRLSFTGANGSGTAKATVGMETELGYQEYELEILGNNGKLSNGDKVTLKLTEAFLVDLRHSAHAKFSPTELEVEVSGLQ